MARKNRILVIINCVILAIHSILLFAVTTYPVFALSAGGIHTTIASVILSLLLQSGAAPVNSSWVNTLNVSYGVESSIGTIENAIQSGLLTETATGLVDTGLSSAIESAPAYTELGLSEIFTTTATDIGVIEASGGVNLANTAIHTGTAGTIGAFGGAVAIGIGAGVLINHVRESIGRLIKYGLPVNTGEYIKSVLPENGWSTYFSKTTQVNAVTQVLYEDVFICEENVIAGSYITPGTRNDTYHGNLYSADDSMQIRHISFSNKQITADTTSEATAAYNYATSVNGRSGSTMNYWGLPIFQDSEAVYDYATNVRNGVEDQIATISPDIIGTEGNQYYNPGTDTFPGLVNPIPDGYDMNPVDENQYADLIEQANDNTENGETGEEQGTLFDNLIDDLLVEPSLVPDQGVDIPTIPDRPIIPEQPTIPAKDPISQEEQDLINSGLVNSELANVFPFCIPFDIYALVTGLKAGREAPVIVFEFPEQFGWGGITIDLSRWDEVATILRHMELLLFIIGLAVNTRSLIGATG